MAQDPSTSKDEAQHLPVDSTETLPLLTTADPEQQDSSISDEEAYAKLKAKRAERRRKKLIRRGIVAGVIAGIILIAVVATAIMSSKPQSTNEPVLETVQEGTFTTSVEAKGQLKPISASVVSPTVDGTVAEINVQTGQQVNAGDVLMTIKNDGLDRDVTEAQRALAAAQEDFATAKGPWPAHRAQRPSMMRATLPLPTPPRNKAPSRAPSAPWNPPRRPSTRPMPAPPSAP